MQIKPNHFHGAPCPKGHGTLRYRSTRICVECRRIHQKTDSENQRARSARWRAANKEREHERFRRWCIENPDKVKAKDARYIARAKAAEGVTTKADIDALFEKQGGKCAYYAHCGNELVGKFDCDHIVPLLKGGTNWPSNRQLLCTFCNGRKGHKDPEKFAAELARAPACVVSVFAADAVSPP